jgi:hypothetical protein
MSSPATGMQASRADASSEGIGAPPPQPMVDNKQAP